MLAISGWYKMSEATAVIDGSAAMGVGHIHQSFMFHVARNILTFASRSSVQQ